MDNYQKLRPSGGYRKLRTFQIATIIYDATFWFCEKFIDPRSRTNDQMVQAARSGRQNIAEGSRASATSSQTELRLVNVARSSLEELLLDYEDYLRHRHLEQWHSDSPEALELRNVPRNYDKTHQNNMTDLTDYERWELYSPWLDHERPEIRANALICLINQCTFMLDKQIASLEQNFVEGGGYSEKLAEKRLLHRQRAADDEIPACPLCGKAMVLRTSKTGKNQGKQFWGCSGYPNCHGTREF